MTFVEKSNTKNIWTQIRHEINNLIRFLLLWISFIEYLYTYANIKILNRTNVRYIFYKKFQNYDKFYFKFVNALRHIESNDWIVKSCKLNRTTRLFHLLSAAACLWVISYLKIFYLSGASSLFSSFSPYYHH